MSYRFIEHTADIAVQVSDNNLEDLFKSSAMAWLDSVAEPTNLEVKEEKKLHLSENSIEELLINFLQELNFLLSARKWICISILDLNINKTADWKLNATLSGENLNLNRHELKEEVKAVTFHQVKIENKNGVYSTLIVFDI